MLEIQKYLCSFDSITQAHFFLKEDHDLRIKKIINTQGELYEYEYNANKSDLKPHINSIKKEASRLILDTKHCIVSRSIPRFFCHNNPKAEYIDWNSATASPKITEGILVTLYYSQNQHGWAAQLPVNSSKCSIDVINAIEDILKERTNLDFPFTLLGDSPFSLLEKHKCYIFKYLEDRHTLKLLTIYSTIDCSESPIHDVHSIADDLNIAYPCTTTVTSIEDVLILAINNKYTYIVHDKNHNRIQVSTAGVNEEERLSLESIMELVIPEITPEKLITKLPHYEKIINVLFHGKTSLKALLYDLWDKFGYIERDAFYNTIGEYDRNIQLILSMKRVQPSIYISEALEDIYSKDYLSMINSVMDKQLIKRTYEECCK